ncbi:MAG: M56 family metallopeptidase [Gemmatimonadota bacterium]|nr:M56 family metallopeptidase [Gemmatimonadota bacterium]
MNISFGTIQLAVLAAFWFAALSAVASALFYPVMRRPLCRLTPAMRSNALFIWCIAPAAAAVMLTTLAFLPSIFTSLGICVDHWYVHDEKHIHLCLTHPTDPVNGLLPWTIILACITGLTGMVSIQALNLLRTRRLLRTLKTASRYDVRHDIQLVDSGAPFAFACSLGKPRIFVSSKVLDSLSPEQLEVVLAHERAHLCGHSILKEHIARLLSVLHLPWVRKQLLADLSAAREQLCDEEAVSRVGDRLQVADTILAVERLFKSLAPRMPVPAASFIGSNVIDRIESLLSPQSRPNPSRVNLALLAAGFITLICFSIIPLHNLTELILELLTG